MATGPSPRVRQEFRKYLTNTVASEGEPAALGKSATGPVYYTDYDGVIHKNRVWFRKGANKEIVGVARADNQGLPDVPNLPIRVARRFGSNWVVDWQRENAAVPTGGGGDSFVPNEYWFTAPDFGPAVEDTPGSVELITFGNPLFTPVYRLGDGVLESIGTGFVSLVAGTTVDLYIYWVTHLNATGNWMAGTIVHSDAEGERASGYTVGGDSNSIESGVVANGATLHWEVQVLHRTHTVTVAADDLVRIQIERDGSHANDTLTDSFSTDVNILGMKVVVSGGAAGGGATATSGVHTFPAGAMLADGTSPVVDTPGWAFWEGENSDALSLLFVAEKNSETLKLTLHWVGYAFSSGDVVFNIGFSTAAVGAARGSDFDDTTVTLTAGPSHEHMVSNITLNFTTLTAGQVSVGDIVNIDIYREALDAADTSSSYVGVYFATVTENGDGA